MIEDFGRNFIRSDFACPCCDRCEMSPLLITRLQALRDILKRPLKVNSGFRCVAHNLKVDGRPKSKHLEGLAVDISTAGWLPDEKLRLFGLAEALEFGGFGCYPIFVHLDVREGAKARWRF